MQKEGCELEIMECPDCYFEFANLAELFPLFVVGVLKAHSLQGGYFCCESTQLTTITSMTQLGQGLTSKWNRRNRKWYRAVGVLLSVGPTTQPGAAKNSHAAQALPRRAQNMFRFSL